MHFAAWASFGHVWVVSYLYKVPVRYAQSVKSVTYHDRHGHDPVLDPFLLSGRLGHQRRHQLLQRGFEWARDGILLSLHGRFLFLFCLTGFYITLIKALNTSPLNPLKTKSCQSSYSLTVRESFYFLFFIFSFYLFTNSLFFLALVPTYLLCLNII